MTSRRVIRTRRADEDVDNAVAYYTGQGAHDAALSFLDALEDAATLLGEYPSIGSLRFAIETNIANLRTFALQRYPYVIVYTDDPDAVRVHRVLHTSRDIPAELA